MCYCLYNNLIRENYIKNALSHVEMVDIVCLDNVCVNHPLLVIIVNFKLNLNKECQYENYYLLLALLSIYVNDIFMFSWYWYNNYYIRNT